MHNIMVILQVMQMPIESKINDSSLIDVEGGVIGTQMGVIMCIAFGGWEFSMLNGTDV